MKATIIQCLLLCLSGSVITAYGSDLQRQAGVNVKPMSMTVSAADTCPSWSASTAYTTGQCATYQGNTYAAKWWTQGDVPGVDPWGPWELTTPKPPPPPPPTPTNLIFSPYKDLTTNMNWNTNVISTEVTGQLKPVLSVMPSKLNTLTWAFATGECGQENWAGVTPQQVVSSNVQNTINAGKTYIISTGGAAGSFTCGSDAGFDKFIKTYYSPNMLGIDFDIEAGQTQDVVNNLILRVITAQRNFPKLRFSFTLATLGGNAAQSLGQTGVMVMNAIKSYGLTHYTINLMVMDYGSATPGNCMIGVDGRCDMGKSAVQAAINLHGYYGTPFNQIELTPMIGGNDTQDEIFTNADVATLSSFVKQYGLVGVHHWSFDRDRDCPPGSASSICNSYGQAGTLGFTNRFISALGF